MIDITTYRSDLNANLQQMAQLLTPLTQEALMYKEAEEWNLIEILEHVLLTETAVLGFITKGSGNFSDDLELFGFDKLKKVMIDYRHKKVKAPAPFVPNAKNKQLNNLLLELQSGRNKLMEDIQSATLWMSAEVHPHPMLGEMTVVDWLHFVLLHSERHFLQMQEQLARFNNSKAGS